MPCNRSEPEPEHVGLPRQSAGLQSGPSPAPAAATTSLTEGIVTFRPEPQSAGFSDILGLRSAETPELAMGTGLLATFLLLQMWPLIHAPDDTGGTIPLGLCSCQTGTSIWTQNQAQGSRH